MSKAKMNVEQYAREVLLFLLACIDCERAKKDFRDCWPILDKKQEAGNDDIDFLKI